MNLILYARHPRYPIVHLMVRYLVFVQGVLVRKNNKKTLMVNWKEKKKWEIT
jgi:hypothetical protein